MKYKIITIILTSFLTFSIIGCEDNYTPIPQKEQNKQSKDKENSSNKQDDDLDVIISPTGSITVI